MSEKIIISLVYFWFLRTHRMRQKMKGNKFKKVITFFEGAGIIAAAVYWGMNILEKLVEWKESGTLLRVWNLIQETFLLLACFFLMWILHRLAMFMLHKIWPDTFDEYGHLKN